MKAEDRKRIEFAVLLAETSGKEIMKYFRRPVEVETKENLTPVTIADRNAELLMRGLLEKTFPDHGIIGEEYGTTNGEAEFVWVLDPVDGTKTFIAGAPLFGTLIALCKNGTPILGVINLPALGEMYVGDGRRTTRNGKRAAMRECRALSDAVLLTTDYYEVARYKTREGFDALAGRARYMRTWGDCYGYTLLCSGFADIMVDPLMKPWDYCALIPVVQGAGGMITNYEGGDPLTSDSIVAAHPAIHSDVIALLNGAGKKKKS